MTIYWPPSIGPTSVWLTASPKQKSALAMIEGRSPPEVGLVGERLARAEARIMGEMSAIILLNFTLKISDHSFLESF